MASGCEPIFCKFYKFLVLEEIAFNKEPPKQHYGKCSVIGRIILEHGNIFYLENLHFNLPSKYMVPSGTCKIRLLTQLLEREVIEVNKTCEVFGELFLFNTSDSLEASVLPKTSREVLLEVKNVRRRQQLELANVEAIETRYVPALQLHGLHFFDQAAELIANNVKLRVLGRQIDKKFDPEVLFINY